MRAHIIVLVKFVSLHSTLTGQKETASSFFRLEGNFPDETRGEAEVMVWIESAVITLQEIYAGNSSVATTIQLSMDMLFILPSLKNLAMAPRIFVFPEKSFLLEILSHARSV